jgi:hypothetical protein
MSDCCPSSRVRSMPLRLGDRLPFIGQGGGDLQACCTISLRVRYGVQCRRVDGRPGESCSSHGIVARPVLEQERLRG